MKKHIKAKLESLISGRTQSLTLDYADQTISRETIVDEINFLILNFFPGCWSKGHFVEKESDYIVYDIQVSDLESSKNFSAIRMIEIDTGFRLLRV